VKSEVAYGGEEWLLRRTAITLYSLKYRECTNQCNGDENPFQVRLVGLEDLAKATLMFSFQ
jgi:hypothetical protein